MKRSVIVLLSAAVLTGFASLASAEAKIGVVSTNRLMSEAPQVRMANDAIRAEFAPREKEIQTLGQKLKEREEKSASAHCDVHGILPTSSRKRSRRK